MIQLDLQPDVEARLVAEAQSCGLALDRYIEQIVTSRVFDPEEIELQRNLQRGLSEIADGNTLPARGVFVQLREEYGIRG